MANSVRFHLNSIRAVNSFAGFGTDGHDRTSERSYKRGEFPAETRGLDMDALYLIIAFVVVIAILNVVSTGRLD